MSFFADSQAMSGGQIPFQRTIDPSKLGMFLNLEQAELLRLQRYREFWRFYYGKHWNFIREDGDPLVTFNYYKKVIDKSVAFLLGKGFNLTVPDPLMSLTGPFIKEVWKANGGKLGLKLQWDIGLMGGITGDVFIMVTYRESSALDRRINPFSEGSIVIQLLGSEQVFPDWDPLNLDVMRSVRIETLYYDARPTADFGEDDRSSEGRQLNIRRYTQIITPETITEHLQGTEAQVRPNVLGEVPIVHIKNLPAPKEPYGVADGLELIDVNKEINEKATDISDMVNYHAQPVTVVTGAKAKDLEKGPRMVWSGLPTDAKVTNLRLEGEIGASREYLELVKETFLEMADTPEGALGKNQPISNTAGVALHMQYLPAVEKMRRKKPAYEGGFEDVNYFILRIGHVMKLLDLPFDICKNCGGKVALALEPRKDPTTGEVMMRDGKQVIDRVPRCYHMHPETYEYLDPMDMKVRFVRQYSFGSEVREEPYWRVLAEHREISRSFWDPSPQTTIDVEAKNEDAEVQRVAKGQTPSDEHSPAVEKVEAEMPPMPPSQIEVPAEPEQVRIVIQFFDARTGEIEREREVLRTLVPTDCIHPVYLNPYENEVEMNDPLPKDEHLRAQLHKQYLQMKVVSRKWVQRQIPEIAPHMVEIDEEIKDDIAEFGNDFVGIQQTEMQGMEMEMNAQADSPPSMQTGETAGQERGLNTGRQ